ncbi:MAG: peptide-methionine (S)-S-oxide reductase [Candidatus Doudnabacteria bacterium RIFCSPHIGHO2_01_FULL_45_18]|uniref:Peptide methionine sulfoxide reductase MsrA n=1 Tax=Candidatus Doudnabacteria bacterium RIFCSPHIGHO2_01_FULL_45_18 TaxID=1817823 RepID=A0A1F5NRU2_9BACT|nr:MAG: peptide-methionine (S)-S-oxide reductase [Candidatus Doudnabacteria bacterium RIFCSPHIGHO2_01_FULL_45_18]
MSKPELAIFGGGCFWCTEAIFSRLRGVESVESGYTGGSLAKPTYEQVSMGNTGHVESIKIEFDPSAVKYSDLLNVFFATHDPTTLNRQGNDVGEQYRSAIFYTTPQQKKTAEEFIQKLADEETFDDPIVTAVSPLDKFWPAESYHQRYYEQNANKPYCQVVINPKLAKLRQKFAPLLKPT